MGISNTLDIKKPVLSYDGWEAFCEGVMVFSLCACIFVLPASIAILDSFVALAVLSYLLKKTGRMIAGWPPHLNVLGRIHFIWNGFAPPDNFLNCPLQILAVSFLVSVLFSQYPGLSLMAFFGKFIKSLFFCFCVIEAFSGQKRFWIFLSVFLLTAFLVAVNGIIQHYAGKDLIKGIPIGTENLISTHRISSTFVSANAFGAYLLPVIGLSLSFLFTATSRKSWILAGLLFFQVVLLLICLCWTYSRSSWVGFMSIVLLMALLDRRKIFLAGILGLIFIAFFLPSLNHTRHMHLIEDSEQSSQEKYSLSNVKVALEHGGSGRAAYWKKAISIIRSSPIWGTGLNTYGKIIKKDSDPAHQWYAHNCYLQLAAETGLAGLFCFLGLIGVLFWQGIIACGRLKDGWQLAFLQGSLAGLFGFLVQSFFDNTFFTVQLGLLMWLMFGLVVALTRSGSCLCNGKMV